MDKLKAKEKQKVGVMLANADLLDKIREAIQQPPSDMRGTIRPSLNGSETASALIDVALLFMHQWVCNKYIVYDFAGYLRNLDEHVNKTIESCNAVLQQTIDLGSIPDTGHRFISFGVPDAPGSHGISMIDMRNLPHATLPNEGGILSSRQKEETRTG